MVEMHLLWVNATFTYDAIYALGVVSTFDRFMEGYQPESEQASIFESLCSAIEADPGQYRKDAAELRESVQRLSLEDLQTALSDPAASPPLGTLFKAIASNPTFKYSRLFAIGLVQLLGATNPEILEDAESLQATLKTFAEVLGLPPEKMKKDVELYLSNLEKMGQARILMEEMIETERKRRDQREQEKLAKQKKAEEKESASEAASEVSPESSAEAVQPEDSE